jgi:hypothetical protein
MRRWLSVALVVGCGGGKAKPDATVTIDGAPDTAVDAAIDAAIDAPPDVMFPDAPPQGEPRCTSGVTPLLDTSPRRITTIANVGNVLYVATFDPNVPNEGKVLALDPATGAPAAPALVISAPAYLWPTRDAVYAAEDKPVGSIWRLVPGQDPVEVVPGRPSPQVVTSDGTYVYWTEDNPTATHPDLVKRRAIAGGPIDQLRDGCANPQRLVVDATDLYCLELTTGHVHRVPKDGSAAAALVPGDSVLGAWLIQDSANLYLASSGTKQIWSAPKPSGPVTVVRQSYEYGYAGFAATPRHFYASSWEGEIDRIDRTDQSVVSIQILIHGNVNYGSPDGNPVIWNGQLYVAAGNGTDAGDRLVLHCID